MRFDALFRKLDVSWYRKFYGASLGGEFNVIIGLGNGNANYGPHLDLPGGSRKLYAIVGSGTFDEQGNPMYEADSYLPTLIHEFNHSYINPLTDVYETQLIKSGTTIFEKQKDKMSRMAYTSWKTMYNESLVRAAVILYLQAHNADSTVSIKEIRTQQAFGFSWMPQLVALLQSYQDREDAYHGLLGFMPEIVAFYNLAAVNIDQYENDYLAHCASVISVTPSVNGDNAVSAKVSTIQFNFDKPLDGIRYFVGPGKKGREHYPKPLKFSFSTDNKSLIMQLELKPDTEYQIKINGSRMRTADGYSVQDYTLDLKTAAN